MKKILFSLMALVCSMSMNAQVMKVMKGNTVVATYTAAQADNVVFEEEVSTGTAKATINGSEVDVNWVQLWSGGPKFAEKNVENRMTFTDATKTGVEYVWGSNWTTPSKDDMNELLMAASSSGSTKVKCEYVREGTTWGFKFTGNETGYTTNSVFFPALDGYIDYALYWSSTPADGVKGYVMRLYYHSGSLLGAWLSYSQGVNFFLVRPVLKEN